MAKLNERLDAMKASIGAVFDAIADRREEERAERRARRTKENPMNELSQLMAEYAKASLALRMAKIASTHAVIDCDAETAHGRYFEETILERAKTRASWAFELGILPTQSDIEIIRDPKAGQRRIVEAKRLTDSVFAEERAALVAFQSADAALQAFIASPSFGPSQLPEAVSTRQRYPPAPKAQPQEPDPLLGQKTLPGILPSAQWVCQGCGFELNREHIDNSFPLCSIFRHATQTRDGSWKTSGRDCAADGKRFRISLGSSWPFFGIVTIQEIEEDHA